MDLDKPYYNFKGTSCNILRLVKEEPGWAANTIQKYEEMIGENSIKISQILNWINAYPIDIFPEPDFEKAAKVLKENGMTLDAISASNMRHVLNGIKGILEESKK